MKVFAEGLSWPRGILSKSGILNRCCPLMWITYLITSGASLRRPARLWLIGSLKWEDLINPPYFQLFPSCTRLFLRYLPIGFQCRFVLKSLSIFFLILTFIMINIDLIGNKAIFLPLWRKRSTEVPCYVPLTPPSVLCGAPDVNKSATFLLGIKDYQKF